MNVDTHEIRNQPFALEKCTTRLAGLRSVALVSAGAALTAKNCLFRSPGIDMNATETMAKHKRAISERIVLIRL